VTKINEIVEEWEKYSKKKYKRDVLKKRRGKKSVRDMMAENLKSKIEFERKDVLHGDKAAPNKESESNLAPGEVLAVPNKPSSGRQEEDKKSKEQLSSNQMAKQLQMQIQNDL
jgi:hypothetical protein